MLMIILIGAMLTFERAEPFTLWRATCIDIYRAMPRPLGPRRQIGGE